MHVDKVGVFIAVISKTLYRIVSTNACNQAPNLPTSYVPSGEPQSMLTNIRDCVHVPTQLLGLNRRCNIWT